MKKYLKISRGLNEEIRIIDGREDEKVILKEVEEQRRCGRPEH